MVTPSAFIDKTTKSYSLMGIVNVTPDSFYDGGRFCAVDEAIKHAHMLQEQGADIIDIGGASSRPGADVISPEEELRRIVPVIKGVAEFFKGSISVDTTWSDVARRALDAGAEWINDISAGRFDKEMSSIIASSGCNVILMHSRGTPQTMQSGPSYNNVVSDVSRELLESVELFEKAGVEKKQILVDPGIGFAKTMAHNIDLIKGIDKIVALGYPVVIGTSRKSFIGAITGSPVEERLYGTLGSVAAAFQRGVRIFRVHDVAATSDFLRVFASFGEQARIGSDNG